MKKREGTKIIVFFPWRGEWQTWHAGNENKRQGTTKKRLQVLLLCRRDAILDNVNTDEACNDVIEEMPLKEK